MNENENDTPSTIVLLRIEKLLKGQLERLAALHSDLAQLLVVMIHKTSNGSTSTENEGVPGDR